MSKLSLVTSLDSGFVPVSDARADVRSKKKKVYSREKYNEIVNQAEQLLDQGVSLQVETYILQSLEKFSFTLEEEAKLRELLFLALEIRGDYKKGLQYLEKYENDTILNSLEKKSAISMLSYLAKAFNGLSEQSKAIVLLNKALKEAQENNLSSLFGQIHNEFANVYRKLNELHLARDNAEKSLEFYRESGNWRGMVEATATIAMSYFQEGTSDKAVVLTEQAIKIIGERPANALLGKLYINLSGAYLHQRSSEKAVECLEKSVSFLDRTELKVFASIAHNNLGYHSTTMGNWNRAQEELKKALELVFEANHPNAAMILDSLGELKLLRGELDEAQANLERAYSLAIERKREWFAAQALRNLSRCLLAKGNALDALVKATEALELSQKIGDKYNESFSRLAVAESNLYLDRLQATEKELERLEEAEQISDLKLIGHIQLIRGFLANKYENKELATYHFNRSLSLFEMVGDLFYGALSSYYVGVSSLENSPQRATKSLNYAKEIFQKLGVKTHLETIEICLTKVKQISPDKKVEFSARAELLTLRLAESATSRDLLLREFLAVLQQESKAKKIVIAQNSQEKGLIPFVFNGFTPAESINISSQLRQAELENEIDVFAKTKNFSIIKLHAINALPAFLVLYPRSSDKLLDGSSLQSLIKVVELGMEVCALREKDKVNKSNEETSIFTSQSVMSGFIHSSPAMTSLVEEIYKIRNSDVTVLVTGESGTGKELVSRAIHSLSPRKDKVFIPFNCTAVPKELAEGHLFGYRKGAFTGAVNDHEGVIRSANGGTLFLDEIGDLPIDVQPKLLRFLQEGEIQPLGEKKPVQVDVRVIAATNVGLEDQVKEGKFREDLYYRLNVIRLRVPPLRERRSEIPAMVNYYINHYSAKFNKKQISISPQAMDLLIVSDWEGNVRQLTNEVQRIVVRAEDGETITPQHLSPELIKTAVPIATMPTIGSGSISPFSNSSFNVETTGTLEEAVANLEKQMIIDSMKRHSGNISRVARELGLTRRGLYLKLERYQLDKTG